MRLTIQIWMLLALLLVEQTVAKTGQDKEEIFIDGSSGDGGNVGDNEDGDDDLTDTPAEMGSGTREVDTTPQTGKPSFDNTIRIMKIGNRKATFVESYNDPNSTESKKVFNSVCDVVIHVLQQNEVTSATESCVGVSITSGSLVVKTRIEFAEGSAPTSLDIEGTLQDSLADRVMTDGTTSFTADPSTITVSANEPDAPTNINGPSTTQQTKTMTVKVKNEDMKTTTLSPNKGNTDNDIFIDASPPMKPDAKTTPLSNGLDVKNEDNTEGGNDHQVMDKDQNSFEMILGNPILLAALVGAVVLTLITIVLITMFLIYRVKKKDEGSYSLDEPHKVKDPTTYWKDTKEFYA